MPSVIKIIHFVTLGHFLFIKTQDGNHRDRDFAIHTADEYSDSSEEEEARLNACLESLVKKKAARLARRDRHQ